MMKNRLLILFLPLLLSVVPAAAKGLSAEKRKEISQMLTRILDREVAGCKTNVTQVVDAGNRLTLYASIGMSYYPFRERSVAAIYDSIRSLLPASLARRRLSLVTDKHPIEELIPQIYRSGSRGKTFTNRSDRPLVARETDARTRGAPHSDVAEPRPLFRSGGEPLALAAFAAVGDL